MAKKKKEHSGWRSIRHPDGTRTVKRVKMGLRHNEIKTVPSLVRLTKAQFKEAVGIEVSKTRPVRPLPEETS